MKGLKFDLTLPQKTENHTRDVHIRGRGHTTLGYKVSKDSLRSGSEEMQPLFMYALALLPRTLAQLLPAAHSVLEIDR